MDALDTLAGFSVGKPVVIEEECGRRQ